MISAGYGEHADEIEGDAYEKSGPAKSGPDNEKAAEVDEPENGLFEDIDGREICWKIPRIHNRLL